MVGLQQLRYSRRIGRPAFNNSGLRTSLMAQRKKIGSSKKRRIKQSTTSKSNSKCCVKSTADVKNIVVKHNRSSLNKHQLAHVQQNTLQCTKDENVFKSSSSLERRINNSCSSTPSKCKEIGCTTAHSHLKRFCSPHHQALFHCQLCDKAFLYSHNLKRHLKMACHSANCELVSNSEKRTVVNHKKAVKNVETSLSLNPIIVTKHKVICNGNIGSSIHSNKERITNHRKSVENVESALHANGVTAAKYESVHSKAVGMLGSSEENTVKNQTTLVSREKNCGAPSKTKIKTSVKIVVRPSKKLFVCHKCGKDFLNKVNLKIHTNLHTGATPYKCNEEGCEAAFPTAALKFRHKKLHSKTIVLPSNEGDSEMTGGSDKIQKEAHLSEVIGSSSNAEEGTALTKKKAVHIENISLCSETVKLATLTDKKAAPSEIIGFPAQCADSTVSIETVSVKLNHSSLSEYQQAPMQQKSNHCLECHAVFKSWRSLKAHVSSHTVNTPYKCEEVRCTAAFGHPSTLRSHRTAAHGKLFYCPECDKVFCDLHNLRLHSSVHKDAALIGYNGKECKTAFVETQIKQINQKNENENLHSDIDRPKADKGAVMNHIKTRFNESYGSSSNEVKRATLIQKEAAHSKDGESLACCLESNNNEKNLVECDNRSLREPKHAHTEENMCCTICNKSFISTRSLRLHMTHHTKILPYKCKEAGCIASYGQLTSLYHHDAAVHKQLYYCHKCDKALYSRRRLITHNKTRHGENVKSPANVSNKNKETTKNHKKACHSTNRSFPLNVKNGETLSKDKTAHTLIRSPNHCVDNEKIPVNHSHSNLIKNKTILGGQNSLCCTKCGSAFKSWRFLRIHMNQHNSSKPYKCKEVGCIATYNHASNLYRHHATIHKKVKKLHYCQECDKAFCGKHNLKMHVVIHTDARSLKYSKKGHAAALVSPAPVKHTNKFHSGSVTSVKVLCTPNKGASVKCKKACWSKNCGLDPSVDSSGLKNRAMFSKKVIQHKNVKSLSRANIGVVVNSGKPCYSEFSFSSNIKKEVDVTEEKAVHSEHVDSTSNVGSLSVNGKSSVDHKTDVLDETIVIASRPKKRTTVNHKKAVQCETFEPALNVGYSTVNRRLGVDLMTDVGESVGIALRTKKRIATEHKNAVYGENTESPSCVIKGTFTTQKKSIHSKNIDSSLNADFSSLKKQIEKHQTDVPSEAVRFPPSEKMGTRRKREKAIQCVSEDTDSKVGVNKKTKMVDCSNNAVRSDNVGSPSGGISVTVFNHKREVKCQYESSPSCEKRRTVKDNKEVFLSDAEGSPFMVKKKTVLNHKKRTQSETVVAVLDAKNDIYSETVSSPSGLKKRVVTNHEKGVVGHYVQSPLNLGGSSLLTQNSMGSSSQETLNGFAKCNKALSCSPSVTKVTHRHIPLKPYKCQESECGATFSSVANLWNHKIAVHDRTTPFKVLVNAST